MPTVLSRDVILVIVCGLVFFTSSGCIGRTGKTGKPIASRYSDKLTQLQIGKSTPDDLKRIFGKRASLKSARYGTETWEVFRGGNMDVGQFLLWGQIAHDKDQSLLFEFQNGLLMYWNTYIHPDLSKE